MLFFSLCAKWRACIKIVIKHIINICIRNNNCILVERFKTSYKLFLNIQRFCLPNQLFSRSSNHLKLLIIFFFFNAA